MLIQMLKYDFCLFLGGLNVVEVDVSVHIMYNLNIYNYIVFFAIGEK